MKDSLPVRAFDICRKDPWAIVPESLELILDITGKHANGDEIDIDAVSARLGRPLDNTRTVTVREGVAIIPVSGPIFRFASFFTRVSGATSVEDLATDFNKALENPNVESIVFDVDSPGGMVSGIDEFAKQVFDARGRKKIVTYTGDLAASAAYWIGTASDQFYAAETARVGSIGVVAAYTDYSQARAKAGVREYKFISNQSPRKQPDPGTEDGASDIQSTVDGLADIFIDAVARNRGVSRETVESDFGKGSVMLAEKALEAGMIDGISSFEEVLSGLISGSEPQTRTRASASADDGEPEQETLSMSEQPENTTPESTVTIDRAFLDANHADLVGEIQAEASEAERTRIMGIMDNAIPGHEALTREAIDAGTASGDYALQILGAEKKVREGAAKSLEEETTKPVAIDDDAKPPKAEAEKPAITGDTPEERAESAWKAEDEEVRKTFAGGKSAYIAGFIAMEGGKVKVLEKK